MLLALVALAVAVAAPVPNNAPTPPDNPDLFVTLNEDFLNRFAEQPADGNVRIDIVPDNQVQVIADTTVEAFGLQMPVQITGRVQLHLGPQTLQVQLIDTQVLGIDFQITNIFEDDIAIVNQNLQTAVNEISATLGTPVIFTHLNTTDTQIQIGAREIQ